MAYPTAEGTYRGEVISADVEKKTSGSVQVAILIAVDEVYDEAEEAFTPHEAATVTAYVCIIKKDGTKNATGVEQIATTFGITDEAKVPHALRDGVPVGKRAQVDMKYDTYNGQTKLKASWIRNADAPVGRKAAPAGEDVWTDIAKACGSTSAPKAKSQDDLPF